MSAVRPFKPLLCISAHHLSHYQSCRFSRFIHVSQGGDTASKGPEKTAAETQPPTEEMEEDGDGGEGEEEVDEFDPSFEGMDRCQVCGRG